MIRPAFSVLVCQDGFLLRREIEALLSRFTPGAGAGGPPWQRFVFWGDEGLGPAFWEHLTLQGLFAAPKALVLRNAEQLPAEVLGRKLSPALLPLAPRRDGSPASPLIWPLLCFEVAFEKDRAKVPAHVKKLPFWLLAENAGLISEIPGLAGGALRSFIQSECLRQGIKAGPGEVNALSEVLGPDAAAISSELARLALLTDADGRLPEDLDIAGQDELGIFELMRIVQEGRSGEDAATAWKRILADRLMGENTVFAFIAILLREARLLWQCLAGSPVYLPAAVVSRKKIAAKNLGFAGIARLWDLALNADKGIKSGERNAEQAFEMLAADLFLLFGQKRRGRSA